MVALRLFLIKLLCIALRHPNRRVWAGNGYRAFCPCGHIDYKDIPFWISDRSPSGGLIEYGGVRRVKDGDRYA